MKTIKQNIHRGKILQEAVEKTGINIALVTQKAGYKRGTYYLHIKNKDLPLAILNKYSRAIGHDFSEDISEMGQFLIEDPESVYHTEPRTIEDALKERNEWKEKYFALLEKYLKCIENEK